jgi:RNA polymerase sigma-70 factor (ECF subfamily)
MAVRADDVDLIRDRSLVELCQAGDEGAFGDLYVRYYQRLLRFCTRRVGNAHEAEEITQEAFARAYIAMPRFAGERRFYPWLTVIAARLCIDSHRRVARAEPTADIDPGTVDGGQQQIIDNVDLAYLSQAMEQLGPRHREVLELRESHGWSYQQIADHYNVTMGTVEALLFRARKALRREFVALSGEDARWAGLPVLGLVFRAAGNWRARLNHFSSQLAPAAAASVMSVAAVAGGFAFGGGGHAATAAPHHPVAKVVTVSQDVVATPLVEAAPVVTAKQASDAPVDDAVAVMPSFRRTEDARDAEAARPSGVTVGQLFVATDAANVGKYRLNAGLTP